VEISKYGMILTEMLGMCVGDCSASKMDSLQGDWKIWDGIFWKKFRKMDRGV
jgi:hypothetical protein